MGTGRKLSQEIIEKAGHSPAERPKEIIRLTKDFIT